MAGSTDLETVQRLSVGDDHCRLMKVFVQGQASVNTHDSDQCWGLCVKVSMKVVGCDLFGLKTFQHEFSKFD